MRADRFAGWVPIRVYWEQNAAFVDWGYVGAERFAEPFFNDTIERCLGTPANLLFRHHTPVDTLAEWREASPGLRPKGFIFHMSRCGSTLVAQMLTALPQTIVISEAGPIDSVLRANFRDPSLTDDRRAEWLQWMVSALGQPRTGEKNLFIKFDCWDTMELGLIEKAFPDVPWIFLYRNPVEVMVSQAQRKSAHLISGVIEPNIFGLDSKAVLTFQPEEYCAIILARICEAALAHHKPGRSMIIDYNSLPGTVSTSVLDFFQISYTEDDLERLNHTAQFNAKNPSQHFQDDSAAKNRQASPQVIRATERWLTPIYEKLNAASLR
ncbi:MAG TPA: sulfotransferase [Blastocatellia bacterium]|nr:sulfotransferase [Blastocatellia bacterium]